MNQDTQEPHPFVKHLEKLREDRAALAALRRGLGHPPGSVPDMYPYVIPYLPQGTSLTYEETCYLVASLFSVHPDDAPGGDMGAHFARTRDPGGDDVAVERRFTALLSAHRDDLPFYLRQAIGYLRSREVAVNWHQLLRDVLAWGHPDRYVQRRWANNFWGALRPPESENKVEPNQIVGE